MHPSPLRAIAEPRRRHILRLIWDRERGAGDIAAQFDITFGAVSQHLRVLREAGLVTVRREGRRRIYRARRDALGPLGDYLEGLWAGHLVALKEAAEAVAVELESGSGRGQRELEDGSSTPSTSERRS